MYWLKLTHHRSYLTLTTRLPSSVSLQPSSWLKLCEEQTALGSKFPMLRETVAAGSASPCAPPGYKKAPFWVWMQRWNEFASLCIHHLSSIPWSPEINVLFKQAKSSIYEPIGSSLGTHGHMGVLETQQINEAWELVKHNRPMKGDIPPLLSHVSVIDR